MSEPVYVAYSLDLIERVVAYLEDGPYRETRPLIEALKNQGRPAKLPTVSATLRDEAAPGGQADIAIDPQG